jgi:N,N-dimethylformamidase beta subunit-like protein
MDTTHRISTRRLIAVIALLVVVATTGAGSLHDDVGAEDERTELTEELEGIAGRDKELVNRPGTIEAAFQRESYRPGKTATLRLFTDVRQMTVRVFRSGPERIVTRRSDMMFGVEVGPKLKVRSAHRGTTLRIRVGDWPSGLYFARLWSRGGHIGFAPFVVAPRRLGENRVAVVLPTNTWLAYNVRDGNRDGIGDSWYADPTHLTVETSRPYLSRGVPFRFRAYDLPFLRWLERTTKHVDVLSDRELDRATGAQLARAYDLIVFPGHHEYVTEAEYDAVERYRDLGGNLVFLSANNFYWKVTRTPGRMTRVRKWRELGRPESSLIGVQYIGNDEGQARGPWIVRRSGHAGWLFAGTSTGPGRKLSNGGIEADAVTSSSPPDTTVLAEIPDLLGPGMTAQMTYYETSSGARVFAAGAFTLAGAVFQPDVKRLVENLWRELSVRPDAVGRS